MDRTRLDEANLVEMILKLDNLAPLVIDPSSANVNNRENPFNCHPLLYIVVHSEPIIQFLHPFDIEYP